MADLSYKTLMSGKQSKPTNDFSYSALMGKDIKRAEIVKQKDILRSQGLPISVSKDRATPTAVGSFVRGALAPVADVGANLINMGRITLDKGEKDVFKTDYLGDVKGLGKIDITKSPFEKENLKTVKKSVGTGLEIGSYFGYGGAVKGAITATASKSAQIAAKKTFAEIVKNRMVPLVKEGLLSGAAMETGLQLAKNADTGEKMDWIEILKTTVTSGITTPIVGLGIAKLFGTNTAKIMKARGETRRLSDLDILNRPIPDAGVPSPDYLMRSGRMLPPPRTPGQIPIELPGEGILKSAEDLRKTADNIEVAPIKNRIPIEIRAEKFNSRQDFINNERKFINLAKDINKNKLTKGRIAEVPRYTNKQLEGIWNRIHSVSKEQPKTRLPIETPVVKKVTGLNDETLIQGIKETSQPRPKADIPEQDFTKAEDIITSTHQETFKPETVKGSFSKFKEVLDVNIKDAEDLAMGRTKNDSIPQTWALSWLENHADEIGDKDLARRLSQSDAFSLEGQGLFGATLRRGETTASIARELRLEKMKSMGIKNKYNKESEGLVTALKKKVKEDINRVIDDLKC